jgi:hypothetical protein
MVKYSVNYTPTVIIRLSAQVGFSASEIDCCMIMLLDSGVERYLEV